MTADKTQIRSIDEQNFESEVLNSKQPVLVAFLVSWSRPCRIMESVLQDVTTACAAKVKIVKIDADDSLDLSLVYEIQSIPTLLCIIGGNVCARIVGTASKKAILSKLKPFASID